MATKTGKATARPGRAGAPAREGAPAGRPVDRSVAATRGARDRRAPEASAAPRMRVRIRENVRGGMIYYDHKRRRAGDVFDLIDPKHFNPNQMIKVERATRLRTTTSRQVLAAAHDDVLAKKYAASRQQAHTDDAPDDLEDNGGNPLDE